MRRNFRRINLNLFILDIWHEHFVVMFNNIGNIKLILLISFYWFQAWVQGWRSGESTRLPPMWPGFDSQIRRHMLVEFVVSPLYTKRFSPGTPVSPLLKNQHLT